MTSSLRFVSALLLVVSMGAFTQGDDVLFDFENGLDDFQSFGLGTVSSSADGDLLPDCGTLGNHCAWHEMNFTAPITSPNGAFGFGEIGPRFGPISIDLSGYIGYKIDARFIRTGIADPNAILGPQTDFEGLSPIKFGVQWDIDDTCGGSMSDCSDLYDEPVELTETFQTFTVMFDDFLQGKPRDVAQLKFLMLAGDFDPNAAPNSQFDSGDFNADSQVSGKDFLVWQRHSGEVGEGGGAARFDHGNANLGTPGVAAQGTINGADLAIWESLYGTIGGPIADWSTGVGRLDFDNIIGITPPSLASSGAVPEPSSCCLIICGASMLVWNARTKR